METGTTKVGASGRRMSPRSLDAVSVAKNSDKKLVISDDVNSGDVEDVVSLAELESRNRTLRNTERAIMNVLEDTLEIQEKYRYEAEELRKFRMAVDNSPIHTVITDIDGLILYANDAVEKTTGYTAEEMFGETPRLWGKQMPIEFYEDLWKTIKTLKKPFFSEITNKRKNGRQYIVDAGIFPLLDEKGDVSFFVGVERDVTPEKRYQEELLAQASVLEKTNIEILKEKERAEGVLRFLRSIGSGVFATDREGRIVFMNKSAEDLTGYPVSDTEGSHYSKIFCFSFEHNRTPGCARIVEEAIDENRSDRGGATRIVITRRDGEEVPVTYTAAPIRDAEGVAIGCIVTLEDASRDRQTEALRDDFLSVAAHQLRTPLTGIRWGLELLLEEKDVPESVRKELTKIHESSRQMSYLIDGLIDESRLDQVIRTEMPECVDPANIVAEVVDGLRSEAKRIGTKMSLHSEGKGGAMVVPRAGLLEVVRNIVSNAVKYSRKGGSVEIVTSRKDGYFLVSVADSGIGIPKSEQDRVFSKFFRATNAVLKESEGAGIGLSAVKSFLDGMGGRIWFESEEGVGTTFYVEVPDLSASKHGKRKAK
ncbi:MAG: PAS domain S-box protein [Candidatus Moranbacteria bacterium]|nr:PAS domain S-box protein [Candidatus Moranbacteria bacterium]